MPKCYMIASPRGTGVPHSGQRCHCLLSSGEIQCCPGDGQELSFFLESQPRCCLHRHVACVLQQVPGTCAPPGVCRHCQVSCRAHQSPQCAQTRSCLLELSLDSRSFLTEAGKGPPHSPLEVCFVTRGLEQGFCGTHGPTEIW